MQESAGRVEIRALNFKQLNQVLKIATDKKLKEVQLCLEGVYRVALVAMHSRFILVMVGG